MKNHQRYREVERALFADAGIDPKEHWLELPGTTGRTRVLEVGDGTPTLFLHGGPMAAATWSYVAAASDGLRCLLLDRPGCGLSDPPADVPTPATLPRYVEQLTASVVDALELDAAAVVGSSFGGYSALRSAGAHPDRVRAVVLAGTPPFVPGWTQLSFFRLLRTPVVGRLILSAPVTPGSVRMSLKQFGEGQALASGRISPEMLQWSRAWQRDTDTMANDAAMIRACGTMRRGFAPELDLTDAELAAVDAPCLLLAGSEDPIGDDGFMRALAARLPRADVEVIEGAGHLPWLGHAERVARSISSFVAGAGER